ncbi:MAG: DinB family protein, partial [Phycisphaeraceae bacterium]|nr:DinB family protein [Phycisphaeraceae bacterium]
PRSGSLRAGDLLAAWCAHDALHLRQLARRLHELTVVRGGGFDAGYAGDW